MAERALVVTTDRELDAVTVAGQVASRHAARNAFNDYLDRKAANTTSRQATDLALFSDYLGEALAGTGRHAPNGEELQRKPEAWRGITWGLVAGFVRWQLLHGFAVGSVNVRLSTVKTYAWLATQAGAIEAQELAMILTVKGYGRKEGKQVDKSRPSSRKKVVTVKQARGAAKQVRRSKKAEPVALAPAQADALKAQPDDTPQGRRDGLLMCLLLEHGLRVSEVCALQVSDFDLKARTFRFYREKVDKAQLHRMTPATWRAAKKYFACDALAVGPLLRGSKKNGELTGAGLTRFGVAKRVAELGKEDGIAGLSPHDCRHYWATQAARSGTPMDRLQDAGGWNSVAMPARYIQAAKIANEGVVLGCGRVRSKRPAA